MKAYFALLLVLVFHLPGAMSKHRVKVHERPVMVDSTDYDVMPVKAELERMYAENRQALIEVLGPNFALLEACGKSWHHPHLPLVTNLPEYMKALCN